MQRTYFYLLSTPTATSTPTNTPTNGSTSTPTNTPTPGATNTPTSTPTATAVSSTRIKEITFEDGSLTHPTSGADRVVGTVTLESATPLKGRYAARVPGTGSSYLDESFTAVDDLFVSFYLQLPTALANNVRIVRITNAGTTMGHIKLLQTGKLELRNGSTSIGVSATALSPGTLYRIGLHQKKGSGSNAVLEGFLAVGDEAFGAPFAATTTGTWTTRADRLEVGASSLDVLDAVFDDIKLDSGAMPPPRAP